jgi:lipopolysaccharide export system protein LptA
MPSAIIQRMTANRSALQLWHVPATNVTGAFVVVTVFLCCSAAQAERADRSKPMTIESNGEQPGTVDLNKHSAVFTGNVSITQGTMEIHADRVEISEDPVGPKLGVASGSPGNPARFRQKGDRADEWSEGSASRIEYDSAVNRIRFVGDAHLRILHGTVVTDTASAALITYDIAAGSIVTAGGRTMVVLAPRPDATSDVPSVLAPAASQP